MILFLDFNGVTHSINRAARDDYIFYLTPLLWKILRTNPSVKVVFSTSWRDDFKFEQLVEFVTCGGGENLASRFIGVTSNLEAEGFYGRRDMEIHRWIKDNQYTGDWLAIDDMPEIFSGLPNNENLYFTDGSRGLNESDAQAIIKRIQTRQLSMVDTSITILSPIRSDKIIRN
jgi:hypothetical protein